MELFCVKRRALTISVIFRFTVVSLYWVRFLMSCWVMVEPP